jgi:hypothetical protein
LGIPCKFMMIRSGKVSDPFQIKNLAEASNRLTNIAHRRAKHAIALYSTPVTFPSI